MSYDALVTRVDRLESSHGELAAGLDRVGQELDQVALSVETLSAEAGEHQRGTVAALESLDAKLELVLDLAARRGPWERLLDRVGGRTLVALALLCLIAYLFRSSEMQTFSGSWLGADVGVSAGGP